MSLFIIDIELTEKNIIKELGLFIEGSFQGFSVRPPKDYKPNRQTTSNTSHQHGTVVTPWSSRKLDYDKLFAVFYELKVMNAEVFGKRLGKCRLLTRHLGQNVESLDSYGCPKVKEFVGEGKTDSSWTGSS